MLPRTQAPALLHLVLYFYTSIPCNPGTPSVSAPLHPSLALVKADTQICSTHVRVSLHLGLLVPTPSFTSPGSRQCSAKPSTHRVEPDRSMAQMFASVFMLQQANQMPLQPLVLVLSPRDPVGTGLA